VFDFEHHLIQVDLFEDRFQFDHSSIGCSLFERLDYMVQSVLEHPELNRNTMDKIESELEILLTGVDITFF